MTCYVARQRSRNVSCVECRARNRIHDWSKFTFEGAMGLRGAVLRMDSGTSGTLRATRSGLRRRSLRTKGEEVATDVQSGMRR